MAGESLSGVGFGVRRANFDCRERGGGGSSRKFLEK